MKFFSSRLWKIAKSNWLPIFFAVGIFFHAQAVTNTSLQFETVPPKPGSIRYDDIQRTIKQAQELHRKRIFLPDAVRADVPRAPGANVAGFQKMLPAQIASSTPAPGNFQKTIFILVILGIAVFFILKKFTPEVLVALRQRLHPQTAGAEIEENFLPANPAEAKNFAKFMEAFRVGPKSAHADKIEILLAGFAAQKKSFFQKTHGLLPQLNREDRDAARKKILEELCAAANAFKTAAEFPEVLAVWQLASVLEGLLAQLAEKSSNVTLSALRTVSGAADLLEDLCAADVDALAARRDWKFLVVDDDLVSRHALALALKKSFSEPDVAEDAAAALMLVEKNTYDVIFLDVQMPGMDGFELCGKIHETNPNRQTPVVFVSVQSDFDARARSTLSGGNDLMAKPFLVFEVAAKALTLALQNRAPARPQTNRRQAAMDFLPPLTDIAHPAAVVTRPQFFAQPASEADELTGAFLSRSARSLGALWETCQNILQTTDVDRRQNMLAEIFLKVKSHTNKAGATLEHPAFQLSVALEGLLRKLLGDPKNSTESALASVTSAVDLLRELCVPNLKSDLATFPPVKLLVVDDDLVARRAVMGALQTAFPKPTGAEDAKSALLLATENIFDVIFLDVVMPEMDGWETCRKIRETHLNGSTPIVFVTGQNDARAREQASHSGGSDFLEKPFLTAEITLKALTLTLRARLERLKTAAIS